MRSRLTCASSRSGAKPSTAAVETSGGNGGSASSVAPSAPVNVTRPDASA